MTTFATIVGMAAALAIAVQDFRHRWVHLGWLAIFSGAGIGMTLSNRPSAFTWDYPLNGAFCLMLFGLTALLFRLRKKGQVMNHLLGWGDVWMLVALACWFRTEDFLLFYLISTIGTLFGVMMVRLTGGMPSTQTIPLAGAWALWFLIWQINIGL